MIPKQSPPDVAVDPAEYAALRVGGAPVERVVTQLKIGISAARRLEQVFRARQMRGAGEERPPRFARHDAHVAAVMREGGFCALSERRLGRDCVATGLPLIWPALDPVRGGHD